MSITLPTEEMEEYSLNCPHCTTPIPYYPTAFPVSKIIQNSKIYLQEIKYSLYRFEGKVQLCPVCFKHIIWLIEISTITDESLGYGLEDPEVVKKRILVYPKTHNRKPVAPEVPEQYKKDYNEACLVIDLSPKASAALSRRCLQNILHNHFKINHNNLHKEIKEILDENILLSDVADVLDAIRHIGNFSAHPFENIHSGEIIEVELEEAEWLLQIIEELFDYCFVRPVRNKKRTDALKEKQKKAGKNPI